MGQTRRRRTLRSDVTLSAVTLRSLLWGSTAYYVKLSGEYMLSYPKKIISFKKMTV